MGGVGLAGRVVWAGLVVLFLGAIGTLTESAIEANASPLPETATPTPKSEFLFERDCAVCHGNDARGSPRGPTLVGVGAASLDYWLSTGRMPTSGPSATPPRRPPRYSPGEIQGLIAYVQSLTGVSGPPIPRVNLSAADIANGGVLFRLNCAACHSWAGEGGALVQGSAPTTMHATSTQIAEAIRVGPDAMPSFGRAALSDQEVTDVIAYVRGLDHPDDRGGFPLGRIGPLAEGAAAIVLGLGLLVLSILWIGTRT
jgi:ubiquinol-cytochrome c reductase cytochrome c subunit